MSDWAWEFNAMTDTAHKTDLLEGLDISTTEDSRKFIRRLFNQRLNRQDYNRYIDTGIAGDFAFHLTAFLADTLSKLESPVAKPVLVPFVVGNFYKTLSGSTVRFTRVHNEGTTYETMEDEAGVNRYTSRDFGRVTGTSRETPDERNVIPLFQIPGVFTQSVADLTLQEALAEIESLKAQLAQAQANAYAESAKALRKHQATRIVGGKGVEAMILHAANHLEQLSGSGGAQREVACLAPSAAAGH
jgi:hypothetical protein